MTLSLVLQTVPITARRHDATFQAARATERAFAPYATAAALLVPLAPESPLPLAERQALVQAVLRRQQAAPHPLWQAMLVAAFAPMLRRMRRRGGEAREDREQRVLCAFLQALAVVRSSGQPVFIALRRATLRQLLRAARGETGTGDALVFDEGTPADPPCVHADPAPFAACLAREVAERLVRSSGGEDIARAIMGAETSGEQAARLTAEATAGDPPVTVERLRQRRHRALRELRAELAGRT
ncbi:MAG: hypothetical protein ABSE49_21480 [Polyangiaceae bacterium]|jgi:hypothetical protein